MEKQPVSARLAPPQITRVASTDGNEFIPDGGSTIKKQLTITGFGPAERVGTLWDNGRQIGSFSIESTGDWAISPRDPLDVGPHHLSAQVIGEGDSQPWIFTVVVPPPSVVEASSDDILDLKGLTRVTVRVPDYGMKVNDTVLVRWVGSSTYDTEIKTISAIAPLDFYIPLNVADEDINKRVRVTYSYARDGAPLVVSLALQISVVKSRTELNLIIPEVLEATGANKDQLDFSRLPNGANVHVRVPAYTGMAIGQTVRVRWLGRIEYLTHIEDVKQIAPIDFPIWRDEVIDSIGRLVNVSYTVVEAPGQPILPSKSLALNVLPQAFNLVAPTINNDRLTVYVAYAGSLTSHSIAVRWRGVTDRTTEIKRPAINGGTTQFSIPSSWVNENRGRTVLINYSVGAGNNPLIFSQLLRVAIPA